MDSINPELGDEAITIVSSIMPTSAVIARLAQNECPDITYRLSLDQCGRTPISSGGFGDIYHGVLSGGERVAIKCIRLYLRHDEKSGYNAIKHAARELHVWSHLKHKNVLELLGLAQFQDRISMVSPWMGNGTLLDYIGENPNVDRYQLATDISEGVAYLHQNDVIHGDIKGANVLISDEGVVKLADFGCTELKKSTLHFTATTSALAFSTRWAAPEVLQGTVERSKKADIYALGMTLLEIVTTTVPFSKYRHNMAVYCAVLLRQEMPDYPTEFPSFKLYEARLLWPLMVDLWAYVPENRPDSGTIRDRLKALGPPFRGIFFIVIQTIYFLDMRGILYRVSTMGTYTQVDPKIIPRSQRIFLVGGERFMLNAQGRLLCALADEWNFTTTYADLMSAIAEVARRIADAVSGEYGGADDTETETGTRTTRGYRFPRVPSESPLVRLAPTTSQLALQPPPQSHVHLQYLALPPVRPLCLHGTVLVRNVGYGKTVVVRFTVDNWDTTSEIMAAYSASLPPGIYPGNASWDKFTFTIKLDDVGRTLPNRTLFCVVRYNAHGVGEWWDNNNAQNYRVEFERPAPTEGQG